jgi:hypothetical protein
MRYKQLCCELRLARHHLHIATAASPLQIVKKIWHLQLSYGMVISLWE